VKGKGATMGNPQEQIITQLFWVVGGGVEMRALFLYPSYVFIM
jgi:hypothetical protein